MCDLKQMEYNTERDLPENDYNAILGFVNSQEQQLNGVINPFANPNYYRQLILKNKLLQFPKRNLTGKSLACIFLTRFCNVGCPFCLYKSAPSWRKQNIEDQFSDEGIEKFISFSYKANLGYLLVSGGGEPLNQKKHVLKLVEHVPADRIVLVTSGNWAQNFSTGLQYVRDIYDAFKRRTTNTTVIVRVSISEGHSIKLGVKSALNLINIFDQYFHNERDFKIQIKSFENDTSLDSLLSFLPNPQISEPQKLVSDNDVLVKIIPKKTVLTLDSGYQINVGISKILNSDLRPCLHNVHKLEKGIKVFQDDLQFAENYNSAVAFNQNGIDGLDWSINYNGDICTWQNQVRDNYLNLYEDSYEDILEANLSDPLTYSLIDKGNLYRDQIVEEVNPRAVLRNKAIGLRDNAGTVIFEEEKTRLYYTIRALQDYISEKCITETMISAWPSEILNLVYLSKDQLIKLYHDSPFSIITQQMYKKFDEVEWYDFLELVSLGHYDVPEYQISNALEFYNTRAQVKVYDLKSIKRQSGTVERRLTERLMHIKPLKRFNMHQNNQLEEQT